jgi:hypothetical protein
MDFEFNLDEIWKNLDDIQHSINDLKDMVGEIKIMMVEDKENIDDKILDECDIIDEMYYQLVNS